MKGYLAAYAKHSQKQKHLGIELSKLSKPSFDSFDSSQSKPLQNIEEGFDSFDSSISKDICENKVTNGSEISKDILKNSTVKTVKTPSPDYKLKSGVAKTIRADRLYAFQTPWTGTCFACDKPVANYYENCPHCGDFPAWF